MKKENVPENANSIKFVQTKDLMEELFTRFDSALFVGNKDNAKDQAEVGWHFQGDYFTLVGLNIWLAHRINEMEPQDSSQQP